MRKFFILILLLFSLPAVADPFSGLTADQIVVKDFETGQVLYDRNAEERMPTSSMSKVMTAYMIFEAVKDGRLSMDTTLKVSKKAWAKGGSKMFVGEGTSVAVEDLLKGVIVQSGNDATIVLAEGLYGEEDAFAKAMTKRAHAMGMDDSNFMNASGWPDPNHYSTALDLSTLAEHIIRDFPEFYNFYSIKEFTYNDIKQRNRNPLLFRDDINVDGIKTGHTEVGGYGLMASGVSEDERRVIVVMNGMDTERARVTETARVMSWALKGFENEMLFDANQPLKYIPVSFGKKDKVAAVYKSPLNVTLPKTNKENIELEIQGKEPLKAPVKKGDVIATLIIRAPNMPEVKRDLVALEDVRRAGFISRTFEKMGRRLFGG